MTTFAVIAGSTGAAFYALLFALLLAQPRSSLVSRLFAAACFVTAAWFAAVAIYYANNASMRQVLNWVQYLELARDSIWVVVLAALLRRLGDSSFQRRVHLVAAGLLAALAVSAALIALPYEFGRLLDADPYQVRKAFFLAILLVVLGILLLVEQLFRNTSRNARWAVKHLCFGLGLVFAFDFYLYADAVLFNRVDHAVWSARGLINAVAVPMLALSASRNRDWDVDIFISRRVVFHGVSLFAAGAYLLLMAGTAYYIKLFGGEWGRLIQIVFFSAAILVLFSVFFSDEARSRLRLFLAKHFYRNKYEYGDEWLRFTGALAQSSLQPGSLHRTVLESIADLIDSPGGVMYSKTPAGDFAPAANLMVYEKFNQTFEPGSEFLLELAQNQTAVAILPDGHTEQGRVLIPDEILQLPRIGVIVPLIQGNDLLAFMLLARPRSNHDLDWEDLNLLNTVSQQAAGYLALMQLTDALSESRQFETFNRLSAFVVHDLKNVVAQLSLIVRNAERHGENPEFVADAFTTVGDAVNRMNRMLTGLRQVETEVDSDELVDLFQLAQKAVDSKAHLTPAAKFSSQVEELLVRASSERLLSVLQHLLQNAVEATDAAGSVAVLLKQDSDQAVITVEDSGSGMSREFVNTRLFKPFDTTKGKAGMGIGAYEARHVVTSMGGQMRVESTPGEGSRFIISLPALAAALHEGPAETASESFAEIEPRPSV